MTVSQHTPEVKAKQTLQIPHVNEACDLSSRLFIGVLDVWVIDSPFLINTCTLLYLPYSLPLIYFCTSLKRAVAAGSGHEISYQKSDVAMQA